MIFYIGILVFMMFIDFNRQEFQFFYEAVQIILASLLSRLKIKTKTNVCVHIISQDVLFKYLKFLVMMVVLAAALLKILSYHHL